MTLSCVYFSIHRKVKEYGHRLKKDVNHCLEQQLSELTTQIDTYSRELDNRQEVLTCRLYHDIIVTSYDVQVLDDNVPLVVDVLAVLIT